MRRLQIKFPSQIRISGWDFGSSARAMNQAGGKDSLMTYENESIPQADLRTVRKSTTERKSMSTKTSIKRAALVAVASLGLGMLSTVAANAVATVTSVSVGTIPASRVGATTVVPVTVNLSAASLNDTVTVSVQTISAPTQGGLANAASAFAQTNATYDQYDAAGSVLWVTSSASGAAVACSTAADCFADRAKGTFTGNQDKSFIGVTPSATAGKLEAATNGGATGEKPAATFQHVVTSTEASALSFKLYVAVTPDVAGTYSFLVSASAADGNAAYVAGDTSATFSIVTTGSPTTAVLTAIGGSTTSPSASYGVLYKVSFKDAAGNPATLSGTESFTLTPNLGYVGKAGQSGGTFTATAPASTSISFSSADLFQGVGYFNATYGTASSTVTITGSGDGSLSSSVATSASYTTGKANTGATDNTMFGGKAVTTGYKYTSPNVTVSSTATSDTLEFNYAAKLAAAQYGYVRVTDTSGTITGAANMIYDAYYAGAIDDTYFTLSVAHTVLGNSSLTYHVADSNRSLTDITVTGATAATGATGAKITPNTATLRLATAGTATLTAIVKDQFGKVMVNVPVTISVSGRNSAKASTTVVTDANGQVSYSFVDAGTTGTSDVITWSATSTGSSATTASTTITYGSTTASKVTVTGGASEDVAPAITRTAIYTGNVGYATTGAVAFTATVLDASGNPLAGVPVTFAVDKGGILKTLTTDYTTVYTAADGTAVTYAFNTLAGKQTVTATVGAVSGTGYANWSGETNTTVRTLTAVASGNTVTFTALDRFGNAVNGVVITLTRTGTGFFGSGKSTDTATTDRSGTVTVQYTGTGTVTGTLDDATYVEAYDVAGKVGATALKAAVAGTTTGTGAASAAAGVGTASAEVSDTSSASVDAANEATDAANAATDAANAAAEAADAATAAAQDAQAAVAALATQVASLIAGIKAQITTLTNLVIKIQKKVRA